MESAGSCEYEPDDLDLGGSPARMANDTIEQGLNVVPHIKPSATSDLKDFNGRDLDDTEHAVG